MDHMTIGYWTTTNLFRSVLAFSGFAHFPYLETMDE